MPAWWRADRRTATHMSHARSYAHVRRKYISHDVYERARALMCTHHAFTVSAAKPASRISGTNDGCRGWVSLLACLCVCRCSVWRWWCVGVGDCVGLLTGDGEYLCSRLFNAAAAVVVYCWAHVCRQFSGFGLFVHDAVESASHDFTLISIHANTHTS